MRGWFLLEGKSSLPACRGSRAPPHHVHPLPSSPPLPLAVSESSGEEQTRLAGCWVPSPYPLPDSPLSSAPPWGAAPHRSPVARGSSSAYPQDLREDQALPTTGCCRDEISPRSEAEIQAGGRLRGITSNASLLQRGFSACPSNGRDVSAEASAFEISRRGLGDPRFNCSIIPSHATVQEAAVSSRSCLGSG